MRNRKNDQSSSIQYRLLLCIITVLSKQKNSNFQLSPQTKDKSFYEILIKSVERTNDDKAIANAI